MRKLFIIFSILFFLTGDASAVANPTITGTNTTGTSGSANPSFSHTVPVAGQNKILIVLLQEDGALTSGMTWNGSAMTKIAVHTAAAVAHQSAWYIVNPDTGTLTVALTKSSGGSGWIALTLQDVNQATPQDATGVAGSGGSGTSWTADIGTPAADSLTINFGATANATSWVVGTGQTEIETPFEIFSAYEFVSSYEVGEDIMTESWTNSVGYDQGSVAFNYQAPTPEAAAVGEEYIINFEE